MEIKEIKEATLTDQKFDKLMIDFLLDVFCINCYES